MVAPRRPTRAMVLEQPAAIERRPLKLEERSVPPLGDDELLVRVERCGVCRTDLHVVEGELPRPTGTIVPGHEIVGIVERLGRSVRGLSEGERVGLPWMRSTCGRCDFCRSDRENLCESKRLTGYTDDGGYAEMAVGSERFALPLPAGDPSRLAPWMCAGIIGYRAFRLVRPAPGGRIGLFGFGGSAHLTLQLAARLGFETVAYSRTPSHLALARRLGAVETVDLADRSAGEGRPTLDAAIVFAPAGAVVLEALAALRKGAALSIAAIHMSPIPAIDYDRLLAGERRIVSVEANTAEDAREFVELATRLRLESEVETRPLSGANEALADLKAGRVTGALVLDPNRS